jgi:hypothetical protein
MRLLEVSTHRHEFFFGARTSAARKHHLQSEDFSSTSPCGCREPVGAENSVLSLPGVRRVHLLFHARARIPDCAQLDCAQFDKVHGRVCGPRVGVALTPKKRDPAAARTGVAVDRRRADKRRRRGSVTDDCRRSMRRSSSTRGANRRAGRDARSCLVAAAPPPAVWRAADAARASGADGARCDG